MRTTLTIEKDVAAILSRLRESRRSSLKSIVNEALRLGLQGMTSRAKPRKPYRGPSWNLGKCLLPSLDSIGDVLDFLDDSDREKSR